MTDTLDRPVTFARAHTTAWVPAQRSAAQRTVRPAALEGGLEAIAQHMFSLMLRNVASDGFQFTDPADPSKFSRPGCIIAAPSYPAAQPGVDQDYVFNWTRDAALTAMEIAAAGMPARPGSGVQALIDYANFAKFCQDNATPTLAHACYTIEGYPRPWTDQADGPALQTVALIQAYPQLDQPAQAVAAAVIARNLDFIMAHHTEPTYNLWEEHEGYSFFARAAQLRALRAVTANTLGIAVPPGASDVAAWLETALAGHWNGTCYLSVLARDIARDQSVPHDELSAGFFGQVGIGPGTSPADAVILLHNAADAMLQSVIYHSDDLELSEQFDGTSGYEKSVRDLTWSYAAFLSAARAKTNRNVEG